MSTSKGIQAYVDFEADISVTDVNISWFSINDSGSGKIDSKTGSVSNEGFTLTVPDVENAYYYVVVQVINYTLNDGTQQVSGDVNVEYLAVFKWDDTLVYISPRSTVATVFAFARAITIGDGMLTITASDNFKEVAYAMKNNFYYTGGGVSETISSSPNAMQTNSYAAFNFLSNLLYYSLTDTTVYTNFLNCVNSISGVNATSSIGAMIAVAQHPFDNVQEIYDLIGGKTQVYTPSLPQLADAGVEPVPNQWTLAIKINNSGSENFLIAGTAFTVFDKDNKAWVANNFRAGTANSGTHCLVFNPDGSPADISPLTGGGILGPGFGIAVSPDGETIAIGNYGWGPQDYNPAAGSISMFSYTGEVISPPNGYTTGLCRVQGLVYDPSGNLWMASWGTQAPMAAPKSTGVYNVTSQPSAVVCYLDGNPDTALVFNNFDPEPSEFHGTFAVSIDKDGNAIVSNAGTAGYMLSSVYKIGISADRTQLECLASWPSDWKSPKPGQTPYFEEFRQPQVDNEGNVYVGGITSGRVVKLDSDLNYQDAFYKNIFGPWGITIDATGKKFVAGFGEKKATDDGTIELVGPFGITVVNNDDDSWTNTKVMTLPTGGDEVLLANGQPLYGNQLDQSGQQIPPSYQPLMRVTATSIDRAGNLWCANNWKPSIYVDKNFNPGGDGVVIFLGVAEPIDGVK